MRPDNQLIDADDFDGSHEQRLAICTLKFRFKRDRRTGYYDTIARIDPKERQSDSISHRAA